MDITLGYTLFNDALQGAYGRIDANGAAILLSFPCFEDLYQYLLAEYSGFVYELTPVVLESTARITGMENNTSSGRNAQTLPNKTYF